MKTHGLAFIMAALLFSGPEAWAQVLSYSFFKTAHFEQTGVAAPTAPAFPDAYFFAARFFMQNPGDVTNVVVTPPVGSPFSLLASSTVSFDYGTPYFGTKPDMDAAFPAGTYLWEINSQTVSAGLTLAPVEFYPDIIPAFTTNTWVAMQAVDADNALTLSWNGFTQAADASQAYAFVRFTDTEAGGTPFSAFFLDPGTNSCVISNGVLKAGTQYLVELIFSNRAQTNSGFGGALASAAYDVSTHASLFTISPPLQIVSSGTNVVVSWPFTASNFTLQSSDTLSPPNWMTIIDPPNPVGARLVLARPITGLQQFFRLVK